jgi:hypothetical protein
MLLDKLADRGGKFRAIERAIEPDPFTRPPEPLDMLVERERTALVDPDDFVDAVGELIAAIFNADPGFREREDLAVHPYIFSHAGTCG